MNNYMCEAVRTDLKEVIDNFKVHIDSPLSDAMHRLAADYVHNDDQTSRKLYRVISEAVDDMDGIIIKCRSVLFALDAPTENIVSQPVMTFDVPKNRN